MATLSSVLDCQSEGKMLRKLSAIRDYPPGVGQTTARFFVTPKQDTANSSDHLQKAGTRRFPARRVSAIRDFPALCGPNFLSQSKGVCKGKLVDGHLSGGTEERKRKLDCLAQSDGSKAVMTARKSLNHSRMMLVKREEGHASSGGMDRNFSDVHRSHGYNVNVPRLCRDILSSGNSDTNVTRSRNTVREILHCFQAVCRKLLEEEAKSKGEAKIHRRIDLEAAKILKNEGKYVNVDKPIFGSVPGVEIGDEFDYRVELNLVGLHRHLQAGIDYAMCDGVLLTASIVASGGYDDELNNSGVLIYLGHGGNSIYSKKKPEDQKLERGNLALKNSINKRNRVRVIRGASFGNGSHRRFVYDGFYEVQKYWQERGTHGKLIFKFQLQRITNQPVLPI